MQFEYSCHTVQFTFVMRSYFQTNLKSFIFFVVKSKVIEILYANFLKLIIDPVRERSEVPKVFIFGQRIKLVWNWSRIIQSYLKFKLNQSLHTDGVQRDVVENVQTIPCTFGVMGIIGDWSTVVLTSLYICSSVCVQHAVNNCSYYH